MKIKFSMIAQPKLCRNWLSALKYQPAAMGREPPVTLHALSDQVGSTTTYGHAPRGGRAMVDPAKTNR